MDSIKSKMKSLAEATQEATTRANVYEEETRRVNDVAEKFEEQVISSSVSNRTSQKSGISRLF